MVKGPKNSQTLSHASVWLFCCESIISFTCIDTIAVTVPLDFRNLWYTAGPVLLQSIIPYDRRCIHLAVM